MMSPVLYGKEALNDDPLVIGVVYCFYNTS